MAEAQHKTLNVEYRTSNIIIESCLIFLLIFTPLALGTVQPWSIFIMRLTVIVALAAWLTKLLFQPITKNQELRTKLERRTLNVELFLLLFLIVALISTLNSIYKHTSIETFANILCYASVFFLIIHNTRTNKLIQPINVERRTSNVERNKLIHRLTTAILFTSLILGVYGLLQYFHILELTPRVTPLRVSSTYYNSNHYAGYLAMVTPIPVALFLFSPLSWKTPLYATLSILLIINLALSYSWGSVAFGIAVIFLIIMRIRQSKRKVLATAVALVVLVFFALLGALVMLGPTPQLPQATLGERYTRMAQIANPSLFGRLFMYKKTIPLILDHPLLGTGPGTFIYAFTRYRPPGLNLFWNYAHNDYLQIASEMGFSGLTFFLIFVIISLVKGLSGIGKSTLSFNKTNDTTMHTKNQTNQTNQMNQMNQTNQTNQTAILGAWTGILAALLHSILDGNLSVVPANALHFYVLLGVLMGSFRYCKSGKRELNL